VLPAFATNSLETRRWLRTSPEHRRRGCMDSAQVSVYPHDLFTANGVIANGVIDDYDREPSDSYSVLTSSDISNSFEATRIG